PRSSMGSPMTLIIRPKTSLPTGMVIGAPVSTTFWPRTRPITPLIPSIAMVRTVFSPKCWATSRTRRPPAWSWTSKAFKMAGRFSCSN
ncbi:hypothetical protein BJV82DRAFT_604776, partial [Fennellomyces sp. T-0311]